MTNTPGPYDSRDQHGSSTDPDPVQDPALESGGSVTPGDTPPSEAGTSGVSAPEAPAAGRKTNWAVLITIIVLMLAAVLGLLVARVL